MLESTLPTRLQFMSKLTRAKLKVKLSGLEVTVWLTNQGSYRLRKAVTHALRAA